MQQTKAFLALLPLVLLGCGGGSSSGPSPAKGGRAVLTVQWPARGRLIPVAANSLVATLSREGAEPVTKVVARPAGNAPTTTTTFTGLPYGEYAVSVEAAPNADGSGVAQAVGTGTMTVGENGPGTVTVALASTVTNLTISTAVVDKGKSLALTASATDAAGAVVLLAAGGGEEALTWTVDDATKATVAGTGPTATLTGVHSGATTVRATLRRNDAGATVAASAAVTVNVVDDGSGTVTIK